MLGEGQQIELTIEKPAAGGWMIARHLGQVVLVRGAIPGERVTAWIDRAGEALAYATRARCSSRPRTGARRALIRSAAAPSTRTSPTPPARDQVTTSSRRVRRLAASPARYRACRAASPEAGYRMRARLHVRGGRVGFYREGTHQLCDAAATAQLGADAIAAAAAVARMLQDHSPDSVASIADRRQHGGGSARSAPRALGRFGHRRNRPSAASAAAGIRGASARTSGGTTLTAGDPAVADPVTVITGVRTEAEIRRHAESFFQGNRYLLPGLVEAVTSAVPPMGTLSTSMRGSACFRSRSPRRGTWRLRLSKATGRVPATSGRMREQSHRAWRQRR